MQLLLRAIDALKRENDRLGSVNHRFKASCEGQRPPWKHSKRSSLPASGAERVWRLNTLKALVPRPSWGLTGREGPCDGGFLDGALRPLRPRPPPARRLLRGTR